MSDRVKIRQFILFVIPGLFPDQTPFFPDFILTGFLMTRLIFQDFVPQMKILPYGDDFVPNRRESHDTYKFPDSKKILSNQCFFPDFAAFSCLFPRLFFTFLRQHT